MKNIVSILLILGIIPFYSISAQKKYLSPNEVPAQISEYVGKHFPADQIAYVKKKEKLHYTKYSIKLDSNVELKFDGDFKIHEIESKKALPKSVIPEPIWDYVEKNYPNNTIREWKLKKNGQEIELNNDLDLLFDENGNFLKIN